MSAGQAPEPPVGGSRDEYVLSLGDVLRVLWRRLWVIALTAVLFTAAAVGYSMGQTPIYEASIKILVGQEQQRADELPSQLGSDVMGLQQLTLTVAEVVGTRPVANGVIDRLGLDISPQQLLQNLSVEQIGTTQVIQVSYSDPDPERARRVADAVGEVFSEQVSEVSPSANNITATLWERAVAPAAPASPDTLLNALAALVLGLILGLGLAFLLEYLDDSWRSPEDAEQVSGVPTFGIIPQFKTPKGESGESAGIGSRGTQSKDAKGELSGRLITTTDPTSVASEAYRTLRTNLLYALVDDPPKVIVMTSPGPQEGKSTTCANLGVVLAQADKRTLIIDCDLRKPVVHRVFGLRNISGLVDVLVGQHRVQELWQEPIPRLKVLPVGPIPPNPTELLGSRRFAAFLAEMRKQFDYVLVDAPPIGLVSDPAVLATQGDGVLLVLDAQKTRKGALRESMRSLEAVGANVLGGVMNNMKKSRGGYYGYKYE